MEAEGWPAPRVVSGEYGRTDKVAILSNELFQCLIPFEMQVVPGVRHGLLKLFAEPMLPLPLCLLVIECAGLQG